MGGLAAMLSGVAYAAAGYSDALFAVLVAGVSAAAAGSYAAQTGEGGGRLLGKEAALIALLGGALFLAGWVPTLFSSFPEGQGGGALALLQGVGLFALTLGPASLGVAVAVTEVLPIWCGASLVVGVPSVPHLLGPSRAWDVVMGAAWALVGYALLRAGSRRRPRRQEEAGGHPSGRTNLR